MQASSWSGLTSKDTCWIKAPRNRSVSLVPRQTELTWPLAALIALALASPAAASHIRTLASANWVRVDDFGSNAHPEGCGERAALSGGFSNKLDRRRSLLFIFGFNPIGRMFGPSWRETVANRAPGPRGGGKQIVYVHCVKRPPRLHLVEKRVPIRPAATATATATCPRGSEAVSGGFSDLYAGTNGSLVFGFRSVRIGTRRWLASAINMSRTEGSTLIAFATCSPAEPGLSERWRRLEVPARGSRRTTVRCFPGSEPWSAGFESPVRAPSGHGAYPFISKRIGEHAWRAAAFARGPATTFTVRVLCGPLR
jgi:hypothetical protein